MLGAIIGDVVGSHYEVLEVQKKIKDKTHRSYEERIKILDKDVPLFTEDSSYTDDSVLTCAIYDAIINGDCNYGEYLKKYGLREIDLGKDKYGRSRFGDGFVKWLKGEAQGDSYGNGAAMRVSPVGYLFDSLRDVLDNAYLSTIPSHNHDDAIKGSEAVAVAIYLLRNGYSKDEVTKFIKLIYYPLDYNLEDLQRNYIFSSKTSESIPQALFVFSVSEDFEDAIRKAISIGGDSDTIASIVGALAEACFGIPDKIKAQVKPYLSDYMKDLLNDRYFKEKMKAYGKDSKKFNMV